MKTLTYTVYEYSELSPDAKERAREDARIEWGFPRGDEAIASLKALAEHFNGKLTTYGVDWFGTMRSSAAVLMPDTEEMGEAEIKRRLDALGSFDPKTLRGNGDCLLTGYGIDEGAIDGFRKAFFDGERDLKELMDAAFRSWLEECQSDCEAEYSDEVFSETSEANDRWYKETGQLASREQIGSNPK